MRGLQAAALGFVAMLAFGSSRGVEARDSFYWEVGGGVSQFLAADTFFSGAPSRPNYGIGFYPAVYYDFMGGAGAKGALRFHLGAQGRLSSGSQDSTSYSLLAPYLGFRLEGSRYFFLGAGATMFAWRRAGASGGFDGFERVSGTTGVLVEAGLEYPVVPIFFFVASAAAQVINTASGMSPRPALDVTIGLRFYFGGSIADGGNRATGAPWAEDYDGWRYPFGKEKSR